MKKILNIGCGQGLLKDTKDRQYINMDMVRPKNKEGTFIKWDLTKTPYPFDSNTFDEIYFFHCIEHIRKEDHPPILIELRRLLNEGGKLAISYPEFIECAKNYINDKDGQRDFWEATIYGRGLTKWDQHRALMNTAEFVVTCSKFGLTAVRATQEKGNPYNSVVILERGEVRLSYEKLMEEEFGPKSC